MVDSSGAGARLVRDELIHDLRAQGWTLQPLAGAEGTQLEVRIEITAVNPAGFDESKRRTVNENSETVKFDQHGFEEI